MAITKASSSAVAAAAKGDLVVGNATNDSGVLAVGANNTVLTADSAEATGLKWATPAAGGMTLLSTTTLSGTSTTVSSISGAYTDLLVIIQDATVDTTTGSLRINPNSSTFVSYNQSVRSNTANGTSALDSFSDISTSSNKNSFTILIHQYADSTYAKNFNAYGSPTPNSGANQMVTGGTINITSAITSMQITTTGAAGNFTAGRVLIYGVK